MSIESSKLVNLGGAQVLYNDLRSRVESNASSVIDDTTSTGDTDKTWSADKLVSQFGGKLNRIDPDISSSINMGRKESTTKGANSTAIGRNVTASGDNTVAEGRETVASGANSHVEGYNSQATGNYSHAEGGDEFAGMGSVASGKSSHAEGSRTVASGDRSHAEGNGTTASGSAAHSEGNNTTASGQYSHAEGTSCTASGKYSHAEGMGTIASRDSQHVFGEYNVEDTYGLSGTRGAYVEIVGNGDNNSNRSNIRTLDWSGNQWLAGSIEPVGGIILKSSTSGSSKRFLITVNDNGVLSAEEIT